MTVANGQSFVVWLGAFQLLAEDHAWTRQPSYHHMSSNQYCSSNTTPPSNKVSLLPASLFLLHQTLSLLNQTNQNPRFTPSLPLQTRHFHPPPTPTTLSLFIYGRCFLSYIDAFLSVDLHRISWICNQTYFHYSLFFSLLGFRVCFLFLSL